MTETTPPAPVMELTLGSVEVLNNKDKHERVFGFVKNIRRTFASKAMVAICTPNSTVSKLDLPTVITQRFADWFVLDDAQKESIDCHGFLAFLNGYSYEQLEKQLPAWTNGEEVLSPEQLLAMKPGEMIVLVIRDASGKAGCIHSAMKVGEDQWLSKMGKKTGLLAILSLEDIFKIYPEEAALHIAQIKLVAR